MKISLLDQSPKTADQTPREALRSSLQRAELAEQLGYHRIWYAEHRRHKAFAGNSPMTLVAAALERTTNIRVGTGGVLIGFHDPDNTAEAFTSLNDLHPGRVDAGIGRASASESTYNNHTNRLAERLAPTGIPLWILGTGERSAMNAARLGSGYAYGHFFRPSGARSSLAATSEKTPRLLAVRIITGPTPEDAERAADRFLVWRSRKDFGANEALPSPGARHEWDHPEAEQLKDLNRPALIIGTPAGIGEQLHALAEETGVDEIMITNPDTSAEQSAWAMRGIASVVAAQNV